MAFYGFTIFSVEITFQFSLDKRYLLLPHAVQWFGEGVYSPTPQGRWAARILQTREPRALCTVVGSNPFAVHCCVTQSPVL